MLFLCIYMAETALLRKENSWAIVFHILTQQRKRNMIVNIYFIAKDSHDSK